MASKVPNIENGIKEKETELFDDIVNIEETHLESGYREGDQVQKAKLKREGFDLGFSKGFQIGTEVAFYQAFASTWLNSGTIQPKQAKVLEQLLKLTRDFPTFNNKEVDLQPSMNAKFKQACAVLKLDSKDTSSKFDSSW